MEGKEAGDRKLMTISDEFDGKMHVMIRPSLSMHFYCSTKRVTTFTEGAVAAFDKYISDAPEGSLAWYDTHKIPWKALSSNIIKRHRNALSQIKIKECNAAHINYRGSGTKKSGDATNYGITIQFVKGFWAYLKLYFPYEQACNPEEVLTEFLEYAKLIPYEAGSCGLSILHQDNLSGHYIFKKMESIADDFRNKCLGSQHHPGRTDTENCSAGIHWLNLLNKNLIQKAGGMDYLKENLSCTEFIPAPKDGIIIRASHFPHLGTNKKASDIGYMPEIARVLKPIRPKLRYECDQIWYDRLDNVNNGPYKNKAPDIT